MTATLDAFCLAVNFFKWDSESRHSFLDGKSIGEWPNLGDAEH